jgi:DNA-binding beta-propeller fold protein YncE
MEEGMKTLATILLILLMSATVASSAESLVLKAKVLLPGVKGRFDHFAVDTNAHRIFVAALGNNSLEIIDSVAAKRLHTIIGLHKPTGIAFLPDRNQIIAANGDDGTVKIFDGRSYQLVTNISGFADADNVRVDAKANRLYVGYGDGALAVIDLQGWRHMGDIKFKAHPESFQLERNGSRIFVNLPDTKHVGVVDREKGVVMATWPVEKFRANFPMALDEVNHRLFLGCRSPAHVVVLDTATGKPTADIATSGDVDDMFLDAKRNRLYLSCGEGFIDVITQRVADAFELKEKIATRPGARTGYFSPVVDEFYLAVPERGNQEAELRIYQARD